MTREDVFYFVCCSLLVLCLILLWSNFKLMKMILETPVGDEGCLIEEVYVYVAEGQELYCKDFVIRKLEDGSLVVRRVK